MVQKKLVVVIQMQVLSTKGQSVTLVYVDGTEGWINVQDELNLLMKGYNFYNSNRWNNYNLW